MTLENARVALVDGNVMKIGHRRKENFRDPIKCAESGLAQLRPADPSIVVPPVVMMGDNRHLSGSTGPNQFTSQHQVSGDTEIVGPDNEVSRVVLGKQRPDGRTNPATHGGRWYFLFG